MKEKTTKLLQKLHQTWCNQKQHIWVIIVLTAPVFIITAVTHAFIEYYQAQEVTRSTVFSVVGVMGCIPATYCIWQRFFADSDENNVFFRLSVGDVASDNKPVVVQIGRASYRFGFPSRTFILLLIVGVFVPDLIMAALAVLGVAAALVSAMVVGLIVAPLLTIDIFICIYWSIRKTSK